MDAAVLPLPPPPDLQQNFESFRDIKVLVVPIGDVPTYKFNFYLDLIASSPYHRLFEIQAEPNYAAFPNRNNMEAELHVRFDTESLPIQQDMDRGMDTMQVHRKVLCLVGVSLCHQFPDLTQALTIFRDISANYPGVVSSKVFAFEPMQGQPDLPPGTNLVMVPNADIAKLGNYVEVHMIDLIDHTLTEIDHWMTRSPQESGAYIATPFDTIHGDAESINKLKKRKMGRLSKCKGDWALIAGSPRDALMHYTSAIEQTRANNDWIWLGAALEGQVASVTAGGSDTPVSTEDLVRKVNEAIGCYRRRNSPNLIMEATFRLIHLYISQGRKKEANDMLTEVYEQSLEGPLYNSIVVVSAIAMCYQRLEYMRKFAFFIRECAVLYYKFHKPQAAHALLAMVAKYYQLEDLDESNSSISSRTGSPFSEPTPYSVANSRRPLKDKTKRDWKYLQKIMMRNLVQTSKGLQDPLSIIRYCVYMLESLPGVLNEPTQQHYLNELIGAVQHNVPGMTYQSLQLDMSGMPLVKKLTPLPLNSHLLPVAREAEISNERPLFIYKPPTIGKESAAIINWVQNEISQVKVELSNPAAFPLEIQSMKLSTTGAAFEAYPISFVIPARSTSFEVTVSGKPLESEGIITIQGVIIECFNIYCEHFINNQGNGISMKEFDFLQKNPPRNAPTNPPNKITLISKLPLLSIHSSVTADDSSSLKLKHGERYTLLLDIDNTGSEVVDAIELNIEEQLKVTQSASLSAAPPPPAYSVYEVDEEPLSFEFDNAQLQKALPLAPGARLSLPVHVYIKTWSPAIGGKLAFNYGSSSVPNYGRRFILNVPFHVKKSLEVVSFEVVPTTTPLVTAFANYPGNFPEGLSSTSEGLGEYCLIVMNVVNSTGSNYKINWVVRDDPENSEPLNGTVELGEKCMQRVVVPLRKFRLNEDQLPPMRKAKGQYVKPTEKITPEQEKESRLLYWYKQQLLKRVHVTWKSIVPKTKGELCLFPKMFLTPDLLQVLKAEIVSFRFTVTGEVSPTRDPTPASPEVSKTEIEDLFYLRVPKQQIKLFYPAFEMRDITFHIKNISGRPLKTLRITVQIFQDQENGKTEISISKKVSWVGSLISELNSLDDQTIHEVKLPVCFLATGTFKFMVSVEEKETSEVACSKALRIRSF